jgi:guanylate kinase
MPAMTKTGPKDNDSSGLKSANGRRGMMLVLSSPSGAGKTSIARRLLAEDNNLTLSVSATTRPARVNEVDGVDYHFVDQARFDAMIAAHEFLEYATVFGNSYGTPKADVMAVLKQGGDVLFDIDWQGTQQVANAAPSDLVSVFVLPPSRAALHERLVGRGQDSDDVVASRMAKASDEISHYSEYDYIVINDDLDHSVASVKSILAAERLRRKRQTDLSDFVRVLQDDS